MMAIWRSAFLTVIFGITDAAAQSCVLALSAVSYPKLSLSNWFAPESVQSVPLKTDLMPFHSVLCRWNFIFVYFFEGSE